MLSVLEPPRQGGYIVALGVCARKYSFAPLGLIGFAFLPTAHAVGCILAPLRGVVRRGPLFWILGKDLIARAERGERLRSKTRCVCGTVEEAAEPRRGQKPLIQLETVTAALEALRQAAPPKSFASLERVSALPRRCHGTRTGVSALHGLELVLNQAASSAW